MLLGITMYVWFLLFPLIFAQHAANPVEESVIEKSLESVVGLYVERPMNEDMASAGGMAGLGSGVIIDASGLVLTNAHVVDRANSIVAQMNDGTRTFASIVGLDTASDVALLQLEPRVKYPSIEVGRSTELKIGSPVTAIGNPFGLAQSVTSGIVSGMHRSDNSTRIQDYIQLDAPINPGNSGGALIDQKGRLVGINSAIMSSPGSVIPSNIGIGFAIPVEIVLPIYKQLKSVGHATPGSVGVVSQNMSDALAKVLDVNVKKGVIVTQVIPGSPAYLAGIKNMDVITHLDDIPVYDSEHLRALVVSQGQEVAVEFKLYRKGKYFIAPVVTKRPMVNTDSKSKLSGIYVVEHDETSFLGERNLGLKITQIEKDSPALLSGLLPGDIVVSINGKQVSKLQDLEQVFSPLRSSYLLQVQRDNQLIYIALVSG